MRAAIAFAAALGLSAAAHAAVDPQPIKGGDPSVRTVLYNPAQPVNLVSTGLQPLFLILEQGEIPKAVDGLNVYFVHPAKEDGKEQDRTGWPDLRWEVKRSANTLSLQPFGMMQPTVMVVRTETADGTTRHYAARLTTVDGDAVGTDDKKADPKSYFEVIWTYKHVPTPDEIAAWQARREAAASSLAERRARELLAQAQQSPQAVNRDYWKDPVEDSHRKCSELFPQDLYDNGHDTTLLFAPNAMLPAISVLNQDDKRTDVTPLPEDTPQGTKVILPAIYKQLRLVRGNKVCGVLNKGFSKTGTALGGGTGTISPTVVRTVRGAR